MNKISKLLVIIFFLLFVIVIIYNCLTSYRTAVFMNWGIKLPNGYDIVYSESDKGAFGDGVRYTVLHYKAGIRNSFLGEFSIEANENMEKQVLEHLRNLNIEAVFAIDFNLPYYWRVVTFENDSILTRALYLIYQPKNQHLYVVEFKV